MTAKIYQFPQRQLRIVKNNEGPRNLREYAEEGNVDVNLRVKLGQDSLWLLSYEMYGCMQPGDLHADVLPDMHGVAMPVRYVGLRQLERVDDSFAFSDALMPHEVPINPIAVFAVEADRLTGASNEADACMDYAEVGVRLEQKIALLEAEEYPPTVVATMGKPKLQVLRGGRYTSTDR